MNIREIQELYRLYSNNIQSLADVLQALRICKENEEQYRIDH